MAVEKLSEITVRNAKPREKAWKLSDGGGLYAEVQPSGAKYWRLKYRIGGVERRIGLGVYPQVSLKVARLDALEKRKLVGHRDRPMSENTVNAALRAMGYSAEEVTGHGFRATARTLIAERLGLDENFVEAQLAHRVKDSLGSAYTDALSNIVLCHLTIAMPQQLLRVRQVARIGRSLRPNVPKLELHPGQLSRLVKA